MVTNIRRTGVLGKQSFQRDVERIRAKITTSGGGGAGSDHGALTGLSDDDHSQYAHLSQNESVIGQWQFAPASPQAPFTLGANAQGQLVTGLRADELSKQVIAGDGLDTGGTLTADVTLDVTVPSTNLSVSSTNAVDASGHTHAIDASAAISGATTSLLKSDSNGYLQLVRLGLGVTPGYLLHVQNIAGPQVRLGYDASNYTDFTIGTDGTWTIDTTGSIIVDPAGDQVNPENNYDINLGSLSKKYLTLYAAELWVETLVAQDTIATIGGRILVGPTTTLITDFPTGADPGYIQVKHNNLGNATGEQGDTVYMESNAKVEFMAILLHDAPDSGKVYKTVTGGYEYRVDRDLDATGQNQWYAGDAVFNTGQSGEGFIDLYSYSGVVAGSTQGPTIVGNVRQSATYNDWTEHWAIGNLNGVYGYGTDTYGVGFGEYQDDYITVESTGGIRLYTNNKLTGHWQPDGDIFIGSDISLPSETYFIVFANAQTYNTETTIAVGDMLIGDNSANKANIYWDKSAGVLLFRGGQTTEVYIDTDGAIVAGTGPPLASPYVKIDSNGVTLVGEPTGVGPTEPSFLTWKDGSSGVVDGYIGVIYVGGGADHFRIESLDPDAPVRLATARPSGTDGIELEGDTLVDGYLKVAEGLRVGDSVLPTDNDIRCTGSTHVGTGLYVGAVTGTEYDNDIVVVGGVIIGTTGINPNPGYLHVTKGLCVGLSGTEIDDAIYVTNKIFINEPSNTKMTYGLTIKTVNADEAIAIKESGAGHACTTTTEFDTVGMLSSFIANTGGMLLRGFSGGVRALALQGVATGDNTATSTAALASLELRGSKISGGVSVDVGTNGNVMVVRNRSTTRMILKYNGGLWLDATITTGGVGDAATREYDDYDDIKLLAGARGMMLPTEYSLEKGFNEFVDYARPVLEATGVIVVNDGLYGNGNDGSVFMQVQGMLKLHNDAIRQVYSTLMEEITFLRGKVLQLEARNENHN